MSGKNLIHLVFLITVYVSVYHVLCEYVGWDMDTIEGIVSSEAGVTGDWVPLDMMLGTEIKSSRRESSAIKH